MKEQNQYDIEYTHLLNHIIDSLNRMNDRFDFLHKNLPSMMYRFLLWRGIKYIVMMNILYIEHQLRHTQFNKFYKRLKYVDNKFDNFRHTWGTYLS